MKSELLPGSKGTNVFDPRPKDSTTTDKNMKLYALMVNYVPRQTMS